jgi:hypothetical protein
VEPSQLGFKDAHKGIKRISLTPSDCTSTGGPGKRVLGQLLTSARDIVCELVHPNLVAGFADSVGIH